MKKIRNKYRKPKRPWDSTRIAAEKTLSKEYGLRRKKEIRSAEEILRKFRQRARNLIAAPDEKRQKVLIDKLLKLGMLENKGAGLDDVLALNINNILNRRLQTVIFKKEMASSLMHARQHIVHGHVAIDGRRTNVPSYIVPVEEEGKIGWYGGFVPKKVEPDKPKRGVVKEEEIDKERAAEAENAEDKIMEEENGGEEGNEAEEGE